jgi:tripartite-type tricarboxylate transporter receptor subunit TctC
MKRSIVAVALLTVFAGTAAGQQVYPAKPIRLVVSTTTAGSADSLARLVGQKLTESWGQPVIVDNRPGANGIIGNDTVAKATPNGYTILLISPSFGINALLNRTLPYDAINDFDAVATIAKSQFVLVLNPAVPANNLQELIALAKAKPGQLNYASPGIGGPAHLASELLSLTAGLKIEHIPYKGAAPALTDLIGGRVQMYFSTPLVTAPLIKSGRVKAIAVTGETRVSAMPQVPTFTEAGLRDFDVTTWFGILAPRGTPKAVIGKLATELARILATPDVKTTLTSQGMEPFISSPEQVSTLLKTDMAKYGKVIKAANIKGEN